MLSSEETIEAIQLIHGKVLTKADSKRFRKELEPISRSLGQAASVFEGNYNQVENFNQFGDSLLGAGKDIERVIIEIHSPVKPLSEKE